VGIGTFLSSLNSSLTNTILPTIERSLKISFGQSEWIVLIYLLVLTVTLVPIGRLSDLWGHRTIFLIGFALFTSAAVVCGCSRNFWILFLGRALLALGGAMILSVGPAIITTTFEPGQRGRVLGLQALMTYIGLSLGPIVGGVMTQIWGWQSTFFVTVPFGIGGLLLGMWVVPDIAVENKKSIDLKGIFFFVLAMASVTLLLNSDSLTFYRIVVLPLLLIVFAFSFWWFLRVERKTPAPMIDLQLFRIRNFGFGSLGAALNYLCFFLTLFIIPFYFDQVLHSSTLITGLYLTITPLIMTVCSPIVGALSDRFGSRTFSMLGMLFSTISLALFAIMAHTLTFSAYCLLILGLVFAGFGTGTFAAPNNSAIMGAAPHSQQGVASGVLATFRYFGMIAGTTIGGSLFELILTHFTRQGLNAKPAFLDAFAVVMWIGVAFGILGFACTLSMSKKS
jgi:EmrB/QacA subfamily drug resistance transporter